MIGRVLHELLGVDELAVFQENRPLVAEGTLPMLFTHDGSSNREGRRWQDLETDKSRYGGTKVVYLTRDPRDVVVSCFFQATRRKDLFRGTLSEFIRSDNYGIRKIVRFNRIWHAARHVPDDFLLLRYEDLHVAPRDALRTTLEFMEVTCSDDEPLDRAVKFASFTNMREIERVGNFQSKKLRPGRLDDEESFKVRKGTVGGYVDYLDSDDRAFVDRVVRELHDPFYSP
jgi:hypothetical protein